MTQADLALSDLAAELTAIGHPANVVRRVLAHVAEHSTAWDCPCLPWPDTELAEAILARRRPMETWRTR